MPAEPKEGEKPQRPEDLPPVEQTIELVRRLCVAQSQVVIYSIEHPTAQESVASAYDWVNAMIALKKQPVVISMAEGKVLFEGLPVEPENPLVGRFVRRLEEVHVNNLLFNPGLTQQELGAFFATLAQGAPAIEKAGGLVKALAAAGVQHITSKEATYVLVTEDEKVVSKSARVVSESGASDVDAEITRYMLSEVLKKAEEKQWLINEIKNHPQKMAQRILDGIELATSRAELGAEEAAGDSIETLLNNIRLVGQTMAMAAVGESEDRVDLEEAVLQIEKELRARAGQLMSSRVASGFVNEILGVITSFSDHVKARRIATEFLRGETTLKRTERLLQSLKPAEESADQFLLKLRDLLVQQGVKEEEIDRAIAEARRGAHEPENQRAAQTGAGVPMPEPGIQTFDLEGAPTLEELLGAGGAGAVEQAKQPEAAAEGSPEAGAPAVEVAAQPPEPKREKKKRAPKPTDRTLQEGVARRLKALGVKEEALAREAAEKLVAYLEERLSEREAEIRKREQELERRWEARQHALDRWVETKKKEFQEWAAAREAALRQWAQGEVVRLTQAFRAEARRATEALWRRERLLDEQPAGALLWDPDGNIEYINKIARDLLKMRVGYPLTEELLREIGRLKFPLAVLPPEYSAERGWERKERRLLSAIAKVVRDDENRITGALLKPGLRESDLEG